MGEKIVEWFNNINWTPIWQGAVKVAILTVAVWLFYKILLIIINKTLRLNIRRKGNDKNSVKRYETLSSLAKSMLKYIAVPLYFIFLLPIFGINPSTVFAGAGIVGIVVTFAFQDLLKDIVAGVFIIFEKIYEVDDYIEVNGFSGTVTRIGVKTTVITSFTGEICTLNNRDVGNVRNFTKSENALCINYFKVSYDTDIQKVYKAFSEDLDLMTKHYPQIITKPMIVGINTNETRDYEVQVNTVVQPETHWQFRRSFNIELICMCQRHGIKAPKIEVSNTPIKEEKVSKVETKTSKEKKTVKKNGKK